MSLLWSLCFLSLNSVPFFFSHHCRANSPFCLITFLLSYLFVKCPFSRKAHALQPPLLRPFPSLGGLSPAQWLPTSSLPRPRFLNFKQYGFLKLPGLLLFPEETFHSPRLGISHLNPQPNRETASRPPLDKAKILLLQHLPSSLPQSVLREEGRDKLISLIYVGARVPLWEASLSRIPPHGSRQKRKENGRPVTELR